MGEVAVSARRLLGIVALVAGLLVLNGLPAFVPPEGRMSGTPGAGSLTAQVGPLRASFTFSPLHPVVGQSVNFWGNATGGVPPYMYAWNFGDGSTASVQNFTYAYSAVGNYTVTLTVTDSSSTTDPVSHVVTVTPPLSTSFTFSPTQPVTGQTVTFTASTSGGATPYSYAWDFGDTSTGTGSPVNHVYTASGTFSVTLTTSDSAGHTATNTKLVGVIAALVASFTYTPSGPIVDQTVDFSGSASGGTSSYTYAWAFGDGSTGSGATVNHAYSTSGTFTVTFTVSDSGGQTDVATQSVVVAPALAVGFTFTPAQPVVGQSVSFTASASGGVTPYTYSWTFGDGSSATGATTSHVYATLGSYSVTVTVSDSAGHVASATNTVPVAAAIAADFSFSPTEPIVGETVSFSATVTGGIPPYTYGWDFGDGGTGTGAVADHVYAAGGTYPVTLTVSDSAGHAGSVTKSIGVSGGMTVDFTFSPTQPQVNDTVAFSASASGGTPPYTYAWDFGDGSTAAGATTSHAYTSTGVYTVTLVVTDAAAHSAQVVKSLSVGVPLAVSFTFVPTLPLAFEQVNFTASAFGGTPPYTFAWDFGDGYTGSGATAFHTYTSAGRFNVTVRAIDALGRIAAVTGPVNVSLLLAADFTITPIFPVVGQNVSFVAIARGANPPYSFTWDFGDGDTAIGALATHAYTYANAFTVTLTALDAAGHTATVRKSVIVTPPFSVDLTFSPQRPLPGQSVTFAGLPGGATPPYTFAWAFGDASNGTGATVVHAFVNPGNYTVTLIVTDSAGHNATRSRTVPVAAALVANYSFTPARPVAGETVVFTANASGGDPPYAYTWNLGDGALDVDVLVRHVYDAPRTYVVSLTVSDTVGHLVQVQGSVVVGPSLEVAFAFSPTRPTTGTTIAFVGNASGGQPPYTFKWRFGDGASSDGPETNHTYSDFGLSATHTVVLTVCDADGRCTSVSQAIGFQNLFLLAFLVEVGLAAPVLAWWWFTRRPRRFREEEPDVEP